LKEFKKPRDPDQNCILWLSVLAEFPDKFASNSGMPADGQSSCALVGGKKVILYFQSFWL